MSDVNSSQARADVEGRYVALKALSVQGPGAVDALMEFLGDDSWRVRKAAVRLVVGLDDGSRPVDSLVMALGTAHNIGLRAACADVLRLLGDRSIDALRAGADDSDPNLRKVVAEVLGTICTEPAREVLLKMLADQDPNVRASVAESLGRVGGGPVVDALWRRLDQYGEDAQESAYLLEALHDAGAKPDVDRLRPWIGRSELARQVLPLLGQGGDPEAIMPLVSALVGSKRSAQKAAVVALSTLCESLPESGREAVGAMLRERAAVVEILMDGVRTGSDELSRAAVYLLGSLSRPDLMPSIIQACASRSFLAAGVDCARSVGSDVVEFLLRDLYTLDPEARILALEIVEALGDLGVADRCMQVAQGVDLRAAEAALHVIGRFGGDSCIWPLVDLASQGERDLRRHAGIALVAVGSRITDDVAEAVRRRIEAVGPRPALLFVLGSIGRRSDMHVLRSAIGHSTPDIRRAAIEAAASHLEVFDSEIYICALADESAEVRVVAARALAGHRSEWVEASLLAALHDSDAWVVAAAAETLGRVGGARVIEPLMECATSASAAVAVAALQSLFRLNASALPEALRRACRHAEPEVVNEVIRACLRLDDSQARDLLGSLLGHTAWDVRRAAAETLWNRGLAISDEVIGGCLDREDMPIVLEEFERLATLTEAHG